MEYGEITLKTMINLLKANRVNVEFATKSLKDETDKMHYDIPEDIKFPRPEEYVVKWKYLNPLEMENLNLY